MYLLGTIITLETAFICAFAVIYAKDVIKAYESGKTEKPIVTSMPKKKFKKPEMTKEQKRTQTILANIDAYDGTSYGQKEV